MPSDLWMETKPPKKAKTGNRSLKFTRPLSEGDWERFNFYAPMIRVMHLKSRVFSVQTHPIEYVSINPAVFAAFNDYAAEHKIKSFLPRLRSAAIHLDNNAFAKNTLPLLGCFMSPEITSIDLLPPRNPTVLNQLISQNCPNLTTLNVPNGALDGLVPTLASGMPKVTAIRGELASAKSDLPDFLGALPLLQSLRTLVVDCHTEFSSLTTAGGRFQNLVDLNIKAFDWKELAKLFTHLRCGFETLQIFLHNPRQGDHSVPKSYGFQKLINALGSNERLATTLTKLTITDKRQETIQFMEDLGDPFPPLFSLKALQHLV
ncbi:hypothetical protein H0H93_013597 [Arthromyces matolae]|nr:hypothetical protein H0H93_013597 [Arthromyces matolae]